MNCSELTQGLIAAKCNSTETAGAEDKVYLLNFSDIDRQGSTVANNVITGIKLVKRNNVQMLGFAFETFGKSLKDAGATFAKGTYSNMWQHNVTLRVFVKKEESKTFANQLAAGAKIVAVIKNRATGANGEVTFEAYGWDNGLELSESANTLEFADSVVYTLTLSSPEGTQEGSLPKSVFKTSVADTETMLEGLLTA